MENPIKMDDLGDTPIFGNTHIGVSSNPISSLYFLFSTNTVFFGANSSSRGAATSDFFHRKGLTLVFGCDSWEIFGKWRWK